MLNCLVTNKDSINMKVCCDAADDANRIKLSVEEGENDYINASLVKQQVGKRPLQYIACQGPLPQTTGDFWRMVWEQKVDTIAMLTLDMEGQKVKCHRYWPDSVAAPFTVYDRHVKHSSAFSVYPIYIYIFF